MEEAAAAAAAVARRERLKALRAAHELLSTPDDPPPSAASPPTDADDAADAANAADADHAAADAANAADDAADADHAADGGSVPSDAGVGYQQAPIPNVKFRNYLPHAKELQEGKIVPPAPPKFDEPVSEIVPQSDDAEDPFVNFAPKKANWDLRRDVQRRLDKLERRTQKAIYKLMQEQEKQRLESAEENGEEIKAIES